MAMTATTRMERLRLRRRRLVKRTGKRLFRGVDDWLGRQSLVPTGPVIDESHFAWAEDLRRSWQTVRSELDGLLLHRDELPCFQEISPDQYKISPDDLWKTFVFTGFGERSDQARRMCPETTRLLENVPKIQTAFFSILAPGKHIPRHKGVTRGMVRCHLGLKIPAQAERCTMTVGDVRCVWKQGETLFFDDTYPHEVTNDTTEERAVLLFDFERPMKRRGRLVAQLLMVLLRRTAYFKDAQRNHDEWKKRFSERVP